MFIDGLDLIGTGTYADVYSGVDSRGHPLAIKRSSLPCPLWAELPHHPNLLRLLASYRKNDCGQRQEAIDPHPHRQYCFVSPFCERGDLHNLVQSVGRLPSNICHGMLRGIAHGLQAMHDVGIAHRDVKLENVLLGPRNEPILCDFDFCERVSGPEQRACQRCGSVPYCAPEVLQGIPHDPMAADSWSLGVSFYAMLTGRLPFDEDTTSTASHADNTDRQTIDRILDGRYNKFPSFIDIRSRSLLTAMLSPSPADRPTMTDILDETRSSAIDLSTAVARLLEPVGHPVKSPSPPPSTDDMLFYLHSNLSSGPYVFVDLQPEPFHHPQQDGYKPVHHPH